MKSHEPLPWLRARRSHLGATALACAIAALMSAPIAQAKDGVRNLGGGLDQLAAPAAALSRQSLAAATSEEEPTVTSVLQFDDAGRALVRISFDGKIPAASVLQSLTSAGGVDVIASDLAYRKGMVEAYVPTSALRSLATQKGVLAIVPVAPMATNVGATTSQGVVQHRVDQLPAGVDGSGITVGVMSDSYDTNAAPNSAALDIASGDLPGAGNPNGNTQPVVLLEDQPAGTDEGRAMLQIVHDMAPKARLGFATANGGQLNFANNIRSLAGLPGAPHAVAGFKADIIVDDIIYLDEPMFQDGIIAQAVDEVVAKGVSYFSSAGNRPATQAYDSKVRIVPGSSGIRGPERTSTSRTFRRSLYAGGFHDFKAGDGVDIAQTIQFANRQHAGVPVERAVRSDPADSGRRADRRRAWARCRRAATTSFTFNGTAGQVVEIFIDADNTTTGTPNPDLTFALLDPNGDADRVRRHGHQSRVADPGAAGDGHVHGHRRQLPAGAVRRLSVSACRR